MLAKEVSPLYRIDVAEILLTTGEYIVETPDQTGRGAWLEYVSRLGRGGCQGFVRPAILSGDGQNLPVQVKQFLGDCVDDTGEYFAQEPSQEAEKSYKALQLLAERGFRIPAFVGVGLSPEGQKTLIMSDLREGDKWEIYDEKWLHRNAEVVCTIDGELVAVKMSEIFSNLANNKEVRLTWLRHDLLKIAHGINLGNGVEHILRRDPQTNKGELFVVDVGEFWQNRIPEIEDVDVEALLNVPNAEIIDTLQRMLDRYHPGVNAAQLYQRYAERYPVKKDFQDIGHHAAVMSGLNGRVGGTIASRMWAKQHFANTEMDDEFFGIKLMLFRVGQDFETYTGSALYDTTIDTHDQFVQGNNENDMLLGVDYAYQAVTDRKMRYLMLAQAAKRSKQPSPKNEPEVTWGDDGFPRLQFFDNYDIVRPEEYEVSINGSGLFDDLQANTRLRVNFDWDTAYRIAGSGGMCFVPIFRPSQIQGLELKDGVVPDFDVSRIRLVVYGAGTTCESVRYFYGDTQIYVGKMETQADRDVVKACLAQQQGT